jgi:hypothetical protein
LICIRLTWPTFHHYRKRHQSQQQNGDHADDGDGELLGGGPGEVMALAVELAGGRRPCSVMEEAWSFMAVVCSFMMALCRLDVTCLR